MSSVRPPLLLAASAAVITAVLAAAWPTLAQTTPQIAPSEPFAQAFSDIPADSNVRFGVLLNGMQYAIMRNATPPGQASFRLRIDAGSLMENEDQLGLAHFMEHMAFNGTTNIPENELTRIQERLGIAFGADSNAFTAFDQTVYMLELPSSNAETIDESLRILREQASDALMASDAIDRERGVIEGEERLRNTPGLRATKAQYALLGEGQLFPNRFPIGDLGVIRAAPRERFVDFYETYYRPSRTTFVAVGDFDVDTMERKIQAAFENWTPKAADGPEPVVVTPPTRAPETRVFVEAGTQSLISLNWVGAPERTPDTVAGRRDRLLRGLGLAILNRRLGDLARSDAPPFLQAGADASDLLKTLHVASVTAAFNLGGWKVALDAIEQEQRRLVQYGVSNEELTRELAEFRTGLETRVDGAATRRTPDLSDLIVDRVNENRVFSSPQTDLALFNSVVGSLTVAEVNAALKTAFEGQGPLALVISPIEIPGGEAAVTAALGASRQLPVAAPEAEAALEWPYTKFGPAGAVVTQSEISTIGATVVTFANGVRLIVKPTVFRDQQILINVRVGLGDRGLPSDHATPLQLASGVFTQGGLGKLTADEMSRVLAGRVYGAGFEVAPRTFLLSGATRPQDLGLELQVLTAYLTDPGLRPAPFEQIQALYPDYLEQARATPDGVFGLAGPSLLASGDRREGLPTAEEVAGWTPDEIQSLIMEGIAAGPVELIIVGDVTVGDAVAATAPTLGALPMRGPAPAPLPGSDQLRFPAPTAEPVRLTHDGPAEQALGVLAWPTTDQVDDRTEARRLALLSKVLELRVLDEIRERQALAYSPNVSVTASDSYRDYGYLQVSAETAPDRLKDFFTAVEAIAASMREVPPSQDELDRARLPMLESIRRSQATNEYWLRQLAEITETPSDAGQILTHLPDIEAVTPEDMQFLARRYLRQDTAWRAEVLPARTH